MNGLLCLPSQDGRSRLSEDAFKLRLVVEDVSVFLVVLQEIARRVEQITILIVWFREGNVIVCNIYDQGGTKFSSHRIHVMGPGYVGGGGGGGRSANHFAYVGSVQNPQCPTVTAPHSTTQLKRFAVMARPLEPSLERFILIFLFLFRLIAWCPSLVTVREMPELTC